MAQSPWHEAYDKLKAFEATGATAEDVMLYAQSLRRRLPQPQSPEEHRQYAEVQALVKADELGGVTLGG